MKKLLKKLAAIGIGILNVIVIVLLRLMYVLILSGTFIFTTLLVMFVGSQTGIKYTNEVTGDILKALRRSRGQ